MSTSYKRDSHLLAHFYHDIKKSLNSTQNPNARTNNNSYLHAQTHMLEAKALKT